MGIGIYNITFVDVTSIYEIPEGSEYVSILNNGTTDITVTELVNNTTMTIKPGTSWNGLKGSDLYPSIRIDATGGSANVEHRK